MASSLGPAADVLDVGCGDGKALLGLATQIRAGVGIDNDADHLALAERNRQAALAENVSFEQLSFDTLSGRGWSERFDLVFSGRGPIGYSVSSVMTALSVLRSDGLLLAEVIGDLHHQEVRDAFDGRRRQPISVLDTVSVAFERAGADIRVAANLISRRTYPDIYEWLKFQCSTWAWSGVSLPTPDDPRLLSFARQAGDESGHIVTTHHVVIVGGTKLAGGSPYGRWAR